MYKCNYCSNEFSAKSALNIHQKTAKYCIRSRNDQDNQDNQHIQEYKCQWCDKEFMVKSSYDRHNKICKSKDTYIEVEKDNLIKSLQEQNLEYQTKIISLEKEIIQLKTELKNKEEISEKFEALHSKREECIEKIALQPKTTTKTTSNTQTNILNNLPIFNLTKEKLQLIASTEFTHELFLRGQEGAAKFATNIARKENDGDLPWVVADKNRGIVKMKGEGGIIITDYDVEIITNLVFEAIKDKNQEYFDAAYPPYDTDAEELDPDEAERVEANKARADKCFTDIAKMKKNNKVFKKKLIEYSL